MTKMTTGSELPRREYNIGHIAPKPGSGTYEVSVDTRSVMAFITDCSEFDNHIDAYIPWWGVNLYAELM